MRRRRKRRNNSAFAVPGLSPGGKGPWRNRFKAVHMQPASFLPVRTVLALTLLGVLTLAAPWGAAMSQAQFPGPRKNKDRSQQKNLTGQVVDKEGKGIAQAVVYLKDKKTLEMKTHISDDKGDYRFPGLDPNADYEVHAEYKGASSSRSRVSSFDDRTDVYLVLEIGEPQ